MEIRHMNCQGCNNSCPLQVTISEQKVIDVSGNCCHRGIVSANTQVEKMYPKHSEGLSGVKELYCTGCSNRCKLEVTLEDGAISSLSGEGCRRGIISVKKQLGM